MNFKQLVQKAGIKKSELARRLGIEPRTVYGWGENPPRYAVAYVELMIAAKQGLELLEHTKAATNVLNGG